MTLKDSNQSTKRGIKQQTDGRTDKLTYFTEGRKVIPVCYSRTLNNSNQSTKKRDINQDKRTDGHTDRQDREQKRDSYMIPCFASNTKTQ